MLLSEINIKYRIFKKVNIGTIDNFVKEKRSLDYSNQKTVKIALRNIINN